jgi:hypothetical protein
MRETTTKEKRAAPAHASQENTSVAKEATTDTLLQARLQGLLLQAARTIKIAQFTSTSGTISDLAVEQLVLGDITIDKLLLQDAHATVNSGSAFLNSVRVNLELAFTLDWWVDIAIHSDKGSADLGSMSFNVDVGNIQIPSLQQIDLAIPSVAVNNVHASIAPVNNLDLGAASLADVKGNNGVLATDGFQVSGLGIGTLALSSLDIPKTTIEEATIGQFAPNSHVVLPAAQVSGVQLPSTSVGTVQSDVIVTDAAVDKKGLTADLGIFGFTLWVTPIAHMHIQSLTLQDVALAASVREAAISNVQIPLELHGIKIKGIQLNALAVSNVGF